MVAKNKFGKELPNWKDPRGLSKPLPQADFVMYELSKDQQASCKAWDCTEGAALEGVLKLVEANYKITFRWDERNSCNAAWIIAPPEHAVNPNMILSGRGSSPYKALKQALYKHFVLFEGTWGEYIRKRETEEFDD